MLKEGESTLEVYGFGILSATSGESYEGYFRDGMQAGPGVWLSAALADPDVLLGDDAGRLVEHSTLRRRK